MFKTKVNVMILRNDNIFRQYQNKIYFIVRLAEPLMLERRNNIELRPIELSFARIIPNYKGRGPQASFP